MEKTSLFLIYILILSFLLSNCSKAPGKDELKKLDETKEAAISANEKLHELRKEKARLEMENNSKNK